MRQPDVETYHRALMGAAGSPGACSNCNSDKVLDLAHVERCSNFCGERRCRVACTLQRVVIWRRSSQQPFAASVCVELEPLGITGKKQRTEAGIRQKLSLGPHASANSKECWVWGLPAPPSGLTAAACGTSAPSSGTPGRLDFEVAASSQLALRVLQIQGPWLLGSSGSTSELLGEAQLRVNEDFIPFCSPPDRSAGESGVGERCLPLTLGNRICGQVELTMTSSCEDIMVEFQGFAKDAGISLPSDCGSCSDEAVLPPLMSSHAPKPWDSCDSGELSIEQPREDPGLPVRGRAQAATILSPVREERRSQSKDGSASTDQGCAGSARLGCMNSRRSALACLSCAARH